MISPGDPGVGQNLCNSYANLCSGSLSGLGFCIYVFFKKNYALYDVSYPITETFDR